MTSHNQKKVKAWAITTGRGKIIGSNMEFAPNFADPGTKYPAIYFLKVFAERRKSWMADGDQYQILPIEITFSLPAKKKKKA